MTWALIDVENSYVSSEPVFDPSLRGVPVLVLSNGDHCAIAMSAETKAVGVKIGAPVFKMRELIKRHGFALRSSNYELYADMNRSFNAVLAEFSDQIEINSIDESWIHLPVLPDGTGNVAVAREAIAEKADMLADRLMTGLYQHSYSIVRPDTTVFQSRRA